MKFLKIFCLAAALLLTSPAFSFQALGIGAQSCAQLLEDSSSKSSRIEYLHWILGFVTALNYRGDLDNKMGGDNLAIYYEVKKYCEQNPSANIPNAVGAVYMLMYLK